MGNEQREKAYILVYANIFTAANRYSLLHTLTTKYYYIIYQINLISYRGEGNEGWLLFGVTQARVHPSGRSTNLLERSGQ